MIIIPQVYDTEPQMQQPNSHHYEYGIPQDGHMYNPNNPMPYSNYAGSDYGGGGYPMCDIWLRKKGNMCIHEQ